MVLLSVELDPTMGILINNPIEFQKASGKANDRIACPEKEQWQIVASGQEGKGLQVLASKSLSRLPLCLR